MNYKIIKKEDIQPGLWDGGKTFEYYIYPENAAYSERNFLFRVSSATIERVPSDFTRFENFTRYLIMLDNSLKITRNGVEENYAENEVFKFDSNDKITSQSSGTDFNLMTAKSVRFCSVEITSELQGITAGFILIFAKSDTLIRSKNKEIELAENDLLCIENPKNKKFEIHGSSDIIVGLVNV